MRTPEPSRAAAAGLVVPAVAGIAPFMVPVTGLPAGLNGWRALLPRGYGAAMQVFDSTNWTSSL